MLTFIKQHNFLSLILVFALMMLMNISMAFGYHPFVIKDVSSLFRSFFAYFSSQQLLILGFIVVFLQGLWLNNILYKKRYSQNLGYVPAFSLIAAHSLYPDAMVLNPVLLANFFIIGVIHLMLDNQSDKEVKKAIFNSGLLIALASIVFPFYLFLFFFGITGLLYLRPFKLKESLIYLFGFIVPFLWFISMLFILDKTNILLEFKLIEIAKINYSDIEFTWINALRLVFIFFVFLSVFFIIQTNYFRTVVSIRRLYFVSILLFAFSFVVFLIKLGFKDFDLRALTLATSLFITYFILNIEHKKWAEGLFWGIISLICVSQFIQIKI